MATDSYTTPRDVTEFLAPCPSHLCFAFGVFGPWAAALSIIAT